MFVVPHGGEFGQHITTGKLALRATNLDSHAVTFPCHSVVVRSDAFLISIRPFFRPIERLASFRWQHHLGVSVWLDPPRDAPVP